jgi:hypothetical protein
VHQLAPAKITRILPEDGKPGKDIIAFNKFTQIGNSDVMNSSPPMR